MKSKIISASAAMGLISSSMAFTLSIGSGFEPNYSDSAGNVMTLQTPVKTTDVEHGLLAEVVGTDFTMTFGAEADGEMFVDAFTGWAPPFNPGQNHFMGYLGELGFNGAEADNLRWIVLSDHRHDATPGLPSIFTSGFNSESTPFFNREEDEEFSRHFDAGFGERDYLFSSGLATVDGNPNWFGTEYFFLVETDANDPTHLINRGGIRVDWEGTAVPTVPEPATMTALALGAAALIRRRRNA